MCAKREPTPVTLDDLPRYSRWPAVLLGAGLFPQKRRTREEILREYERDKWGRVMAWLEGQTEWMPDDLLRQQGLDPQGVIAFARGGQFFAAPARQVMDEYEELLLSTIRPHRPEALVELGCGLGDKLLKMANVMQPRIVYGGELTQAGVECGQLLAGMMWPAALFGHFDYYNPSTLAAVPYGALVYTSHSIEQVPILDATFIEGLIERAPCTVIHFEPCFEDQDETSLIGLMRRRYTILNDYNLNLVGLLGEFARAGRIRIREHRKNLFSDTPFNPTSIVVWSPA
jgi:hypothetical protein